jgi:uncharacterized protein (DUF1778 family)
MGERLEIRVTSDEKSAFNAAAESAGEPLSDWMRHTLNAAAKRALRSKRPDR